jgi:hypothetical protein
MKWQHAIVKLSELDDYLAKLAASGWFINAISWNALTDEALVVSGQRGTFKPKGKWKGKAKA